MAIEPSAPYAIRQFEVETWVPIKLLDIDISFTNVASAMLTTTVLVGAFFWVATSRSKIIPRRLQAGVEIIYDFVAKTVISTTGPEGKEHIPFVFSLFVFILFGTLIGLTPMKATFTTHLIITGALALIVFVHVIEVGLRRNGMHYFRQFMPRGTPLWLAPLIVPIELISYLAKPITLSVRLFANMFAGHMLIKLFADLAAMVVDHLGPIGILVAMAPLAMMVIFFAFEVMVVLIQSYIFILLTSVYLRSSIHAH